MRRQVHLSSLTVGRCFSTPSDNGPGSGGAMGIADSATASDDGGGDGAGGVRGKAVMARRVMTADAVWKVTAVSDQISAENARGETRDFPPSTAVSEIPRQGFDRMVERS